jgi:hypothetical protein
VRSFSTALEAHLARNAFICADLYEFDIGGTTYRLTSCDRNLTGVAPANASTYTAAVIERSRVRSSDGLQVDDLDITVMHGGGSIGGVPWVTRALAGDIDGASVRMYRAFLLPADFSMVGCYLRFAGVVGPTEPGSTTMRVIVAVSADDFATPFPSLDWAETCIWTLGGPGCDYAGTLDYNVTVGDESGPGWLHIETLPGGGALAQTAFGAGTITSAGVTRTIGPMWAYPDPAPYNGMTITSGYGFTVSPAWDVAPVAASTAVMRLGCTHYANYCDIFYSNLTHHQGVRFPPANR